MKAIFTQPYKRYKSLARLMRVACRCILLLLFLIPLLSGLMAAPAYATSVYEMPIVSAGEPTWVIDKSEVISRLNEGTLSNTLEELAKNTGNEVRMVTIRRLDYGETADSFAKALFQTWYPTPEAQGNQTLLVIDTLTNTTGIVTGETVKSIMSDEIAQSVASETVMAPIREDNKYNQALLDGSVRLAAVLSGEPDPGPPVIEENVQVASTFTSAEETDTKNSTIWVVVLLVVATIVPMATYWFYQSYSGG
ncbi:MAG TPA: beta-propeller domain-containing protein, methanol dehydrogenase [Cyanobacteria bacterium UBA11149]|nr:beta-propeller domain-containing protein, methanol dehydrogenase [Cyanobacteria bacterium UBA11367]HBE58587.1 beta-propeller domain-containing protein, methanol dehydrogenase [Cyanobacteria bacterium UBA11366]HBK65786.1 beta-propeller domain-containing protein, methanol dehydrogenase [Cyanobacteria bacterium UBA11166]HBR74024.1 beta-propeller domain-containing protein, methanol dehydrogenase [Cyanobacteria bacterium UBA11159]HBS67848.1 beta-propeller domain-containing protein, methanol dehyd